jgi:phosphomannomutase
LSSVKFGTSGLRGLVSDLSDQLCGNYTRAFVRHLEKVGKFKSRKAILIGRDLRDSSPGIAAACIGAARAMGLEVIDAGLLPTPALALEAMRLRLPAIMVTGSHIPADRNGLKFYGPEGEIEKSDEAAILAEFSELAAASSPPSPLIHQPSDPDDTALSNYISRYERLRGAINLSNLEIGVYQHSSVARDALVSVLESLGANVTPLGRANSFIPIDTEAVRQEDVASLRNWSAQQNLAAIVSTDGDADRPLIADEKGTVVRGDVIGILTAQFLGADTVVTPVTSSSAIELSGFFATVIRTRVGSPYVIAGMEGVAGTAVGFEANGGVLLGSAVKLGRTLLRPLRTRDAFLPIIAVLGLARRHGLSISDLVDRLPPRRTASAVIPDTPAAVSGVFLRRLATDDAFASIVTTDAAGSAGKSITDGVKLTLNGGDTVHFRASGNAPEMRCYTEARTQEEANTLLERAVEAASKMLSQPNSPK